MFFFVQQPTHDITFTNSHVFVGCEGHTWGYWKENIQNIGSEHGYTQEEINQTITLFKAFAAQLGQEF